MTERGTYTIGEGIVARLKSFGMCGPSTRCSVCADDLEALDRILTRLRLLEAARDIQAMAYQPEENE